MKAGLTLILILIAAEVVFTMSADTALYQKNPNYSHETDLYQIYKKRQADIVFLGNSITKGVVWSELLGRDNVVGRGIPSDILDGMLSRVENVISLRPKIVFLMAGINDVYNWSPVDTIFSKYTKLVELLRSKGIRVVVQSTLYAGRNWPSSADRNKEVEKLNTLLQNYCKQNSIDYLDVNVGLSAQKFLRDDLTYDGLHLKARAYQTWGREIEKLLIKFGY